MIKILTKEITGEGAFYYIRKNFLSLATYFKTNPLVQDWKFLELTFKAAGANQRMAHGLGSVPKDAFITSKTGTGSVTLNYELFDNQFLDITTTGPATIRLFVGSVVIGGN